MLARLQTTESAQPLFMLQLLSTSDNMVATGFSGHSDRRFWGSENNLQAKLLREEHLVPSILKMQQVAPSLLLGDKGLTGDVGAQLVCWLESSHHRACGPRSRGWRGRRGERELWEEL